MLSTRLVPDLRPDEDVIWYARQHWSLPVRRALRPALLLLVVIVLALASQRWLASQPSPWPQITGGVLIILAGLALGRLLWIYLDWADDILLATTQRLVLLQKTAFFHESRREIPLDRIQNITVTSNGLLAAWLAFGDLLIEAAGAPPLLAQSLPHADTLRQRLFEHQAQQLERSGQQQNITDGHALHALLDDHGPAPAAHPTTTSATEPVVAVEAAAQPIVWHRHWWFLIRASLRPVGLLAVVLVSALLAPRLPGLQGELVTLLVAALLGLAAIGLVSLIWAILSWREDRYILDGERLLDIKRRPFRLSHEVTQTTLDRVQDVAYRIPNPLAHLLDYGDVSIQTAGETQRFTFDGVADPRTVHAEIGRRVAALRDAETDERQRQIHADVLKYLRDYQAAQSQRPPSAEAPVVDNRS